jgi:hypothetical protein
MLANKQSHHEQQQRQRRRALHGKECVLRV